MRRKKHGFVNELYYQYRPFWNVTFWMMILLLVGYVLLLFIFSWDPYQSWLFVTNCATFFLFGVDKLAAKWQKRRVPEAVLHLFTLLGGMVGSFVGMFLFRHKLNWRTYFLFPLIALFAFFVHLSLFFLLSTP